MNNEETKVKDELEGLKKVKGLDFNLILLFFVLAVITSVMYAFLLLISL